MNNIIINFYEGFQGEGEVQFIQIPIEGNKTIIRIWDGYFDDIMGKIQPEPEGWTSLAYYYNLAEGWYEESPWKIPNIVEALQQVKQTINSDFRFQQTRRVVKEICNLLSKAIKYHNCVYCKRIIENEFNTKK